VEIADAGVSAIAPLTPRPSGLKKAACTGYTSCMRTAKRFYDGLDPDLKKALLAQVRNLWTHSSTAIEGNTLTLGETDFVLSEGLTIAGKPLKDHKEVEGHARAIDLVYAILDRDAVSEQDLFDLHRAVLTDTVIDIYSPAGAWKREPNSTNAVAPDGRQIIIEFPAPGAVPSLMEGWVKRFNALSPATADEAMEAYAISHLELVSIHPFYDGNGRVARLLGNVPVLRAGLPPLVVPVERRLDYLRGIAAYQLSIPNFPANDTFPASAERAQFVALCGDFMSETLECVEHVQALQRARSAS
jgi:Fic family protein